EVVQVMATQGVLGLLALTAIAIGVVFAIRRAWRFGPDRPLVFALGASLVAFGVHSAFSFTVAATGSLIAAIVGMLASLAAATANQPTGNAGTKKWSFLALPDPIAAISVCIAAAVLAWVGVARPFIADV